MVPCAPAFEAVIQFRSIAASTLFSSFPRKREPRDFSRLPLGPRLRGDDEFVCPHDSLTASKAGIYVCDGHRPEPVLGPRDSADPWAGVTIKSGHYFDVGKIRKPDALHS